MDRLTLGAESSQLLAGSKDAARLLKLAEQVSDSRDMLVFTAKITSKILGKHTRACQML